MTRVCLVAALLAAFTTQFTAQKSEDLVNDGKNTENVLTQSMGYDRKSYSPLAQINTSTVKRLVPLWSTSLMNDAGELAAPTVYNGVMYVVNGKWSFAIDVETGRQIWRTPTEVDPGVQRVAIFGAINRGAATIYDGKLFRVTIDNHLVALDLKTGKQVWNQTFADFHEGYTATGAPIVAGGVVISGMAGGEFTTRGFLDGWDPDTLRYTMCQFGQDQELKLNNSVEIDLAGYRLGSAHAGGMSGGFADGSTRFLSFDMDQELLNRLAHRCDGEGGESALP